MTLFGIDVSEHQSGMNLLRAVRESDLSFVIMRTNDGDYRDRCYRSHVDDVRRSTAALAAYTYLRNPNEGSALKVQVDTALSVMGDRWRLPIWLDCETRVGLSMGHIREVTRLFEAAGITVLGIYSYWPWWQQHGGDTTEFAHLWGAAYPRTSALPHTELYGGDQHPQWSKPMGGRGVELWQYASSALVSGWVRGVDANAFRGDITRLQALFHSRKETVVEKVLDYTRSQIAQDTGYYCGPASTQTVVAAATGKMIPESALAKRLGTTVNGTDYIGQFPPVLNALIEGGEYTHRDVGAYPNQEAKNIIWGEITNSINAGRGVIANFVAPPSNYPKAVAPSTVSPAYTGGTVYHYIAVMGYSDAGGRRLWIADSGFSPYGYWLSFDQFCTLIVPKGYAYSVAVPLESVHKKKEGEDPMIQSLINPAKFFAQSKLISIVDATCWQILVLVKAIAVKQGIDADRVLAEAIKKDREAK
ncbi:hypothetical protein FRC0507_00162 [Corynebacterium diphtheriae]|nr:hypothetical protein FRC0507_00162 [Corynebacterium diphtheriae]